MNQFDYDFVQNQEKGRPMLEQTEWIRINKSCHTLVDADQRVLSVIFTSYDEDDDDENLIWEVEIEDEPIGSYVSLYNAKLVVQRAINEWDQQQLALERKKTKRKKKVTKTRAAVQRKK